MDAHDNFLGRGWDFPPSFTAGTVATTEGEASVARALRVLIGTGIGERVMRPELGCDLSSFTFEPVSRSLITWIESLITTAVIDHEPRAILDRVDVTPNQREPGRLDIAVSYTVLTTNTRHNIVHPFYLMEATVA